MPDKEYWRLDRGSRWEIVKLLQRLEIKDRLAWLYWCCQQVSRPPDDVTIITSHTGSLAECVHDWQALVQSKGLDWRASRAELERRVQIAGKPLLIATR